MNMRSAPRMPQDAIASLLKKFEYGSYRVEEFVDASSTYELFVHKDLQDTISIDPVRLEKYRAKYESEVKSAKEFLESRVLSSHEKAIVDSAIGSIQKSIERVDGPAYK